MNQAHLMEFLAATAVVDFCNNPTDSANTVHKELGLKKAGAEITFADIRPYPPNPPL